MPVEGSTRLNADGSWTIRRSGLGPKRNRESSETYMPAVLDPHPDVGGAAVRLTKTDGSGDTYDLLKTEFGWTCECEDFVNRRQHAGEWCKHLLAARHHGLIDGAPPAEGRHVDSESY